MVFLSFRTLGYVWAGVAATAAVSAAGLEASYEPPIPVTASIPLPEPSLIVDPRPIATPQPPHPAAKRQASLPLPPVPPAPSHLRTARTERHAPETYRWGAAAYPGQYAMVRSYYPQQGYYGWQPLY